LYIYVRPSMFEVKTMAEGGLADSRRWCAEKCLAKYGFD
jgi:hypothetical protein